MRIFFARHANPPTIYGHLSRLRYRTHFISTNLCVQFVFGGRWANIYLDAAGRVLFRAEEEGAIDERIAVEDKHRVLAENARDAALLVLGER